MLGNTDHLEQDFFAVTHAGITFLICAQLEMRMILLVRHCPIGIWVVADPIRGQPQCLRHIVHAAVLTGVIRMRVLVATDHHIVRTAVIHNVGFQPIRDLALRGSGIDVQIRLDGDGAIRLVIRMQFTLL